MMYLAFYKGRHRLFDRVVQWWTQGPYSHTELVMDYSAGWGLCGSSSFLDRGVRVKQIYLSPTNWDLVPLFNIDEDYAINWYKVNNGKKYDLLGLLSLISPVPEDKDKYWCTEANAASLKIAEPWRYSPNNFAGYLRSNTL